MCKNSVWQLKFLSCVIRYFEAVSGLRINLSKSCIYRVGQVNDLWRFAEVLGYKQGSFPSTYLGCLSKARRIGIQWLKELVKGWQVGKQCIYQKGENDSN